MWLLHLLPDSLLAFTVNLVLIVGLISTILTTFVLDKLLNLIPTLAPYRLLLQIVSIALLVAGVYFKGGYNTELMWRAEVAAAEQRAKLAEEKAAAATARVEYVFIDRVKNVKEVQVVVQERIRDLSIKIDDQCKVIPEVVDIHNQAARNIKGAKK